MADSSTFVPATTYRAATDAVLERMGDTMLAVHLGTDRILELNGTAARLVELLLDGASDRSAAENIAAEYEVGLDVVWENVEKTIAALVDESVLVAVGTGDSA